MFQKMETGITLERLKHTHTNKFLTHRTIMPIPFIKLLVNLYLIITNKGKMPTENVIETKFQIQKYTILNIKHTLQTFNIW